MLAVTGGVNTHRGAIFSLGLLCAAAGATWSETTRSESHWRPQALGATVRQRWGQAIMSGPIPLRSHGTNALLKFGAGGARAQAAAGFPQAIEVGLPALRLGRRLAPKDPQAARVQSFFAILASMEDTNLLHRGGAVGLRYAQEAAPAFSDGAVSSSRTGASKPLPCTEPSWYAVSARAAAPTCWRSHFSSTAWKLIHECDGYPLLWPGLSGRSHV